MAASSGSSKSSRGGAAIKALRGSSTWIPVLVAALLSPVFLFLAGRFLAGGSVASAADALAPGEGMALEAHGFVGQGAIKSTGNNYLVDSKRGSLEFSDIGINFTAQLTERLRVGMQFFARKLGAVGNFNAKTDWFYLDYHWKDWLGVRAGRVKLPFGLYNDTSDIDSARVPILLPGSIYPVNDRDFLLAQTGFELYGYARLGAGGALEYRLYAGTIFVPVTSSPPGLVLQNLNVPYVTGGRLMWEAPVEGLRLGGSLQALRLDYDVLVPTTGGMATVRIPVVLAVGSVEYAASDLLLAAEYSRWFASASSSDPTVYPNINELTNERAYLLAAYRVARWLSPGAYYSVLFADVNQRSGRENRLHDVAATLRFDVNAHWIVKIEGHFLDGTSGLDPALNGAMPAMLTRRWALFLLKTTAYF